MCSQYAPQSWPIYGFIGRITRSRDHIAGDHTSYIMPCGRYVTLTPIMVREKE